MPGNAAQTRRPDLAPGCWVLRIQKLSLTNFRNFADVGVEFSDLPNVILGANATGKTNILDAVHILSVGRSHRERREYNLVRFGEEYYRIEGVFDHIGVKTTIEVVYSPEGKRVRLNGKEARGTDLIGLAAAVITSPDDIDLVKGGPLLRRRFLDIGISQTSRQYLASLQQYVRALAQRNVLLRKAKETGERADTAVWDDTLVKAGSEVVSLRLEFLGYLEPMVERDFGLISGMGGEVSLAYEPRGYSLGARGGNMPGSDEIRALLAEVIGRNQEIELMRGYSLYGPHVDDFSFSSNGLDLRQFGSEGEQRTAVLALRCAEAAAIKERLGKAPILLLDDVFAELDDARSAALIALISGFDQIVLTSSRESPLGDMEVHRIYVENGRIRYDGQA